MKQIQSMWLATWRLSILLVIGVMLTTGPAAAQAYVDNDALDGLFAELRSAPDAAAARDIERRIWLVWTTPTDTELARRMTQVLLTRAGPDPMATIELLDQMVEDYPDYAEGWNQRATMYYIAGNFEASIADCAKVLELEPRHFGALSGRSLMYLQLDQRPLALRDMTTALGIHPFLNEARLFPELQQNVTRI